MKSLIVAIVLIGTVALAFAPAAQAAPTAPLQGSLVAHRGFVSVGVGVGGGYARPAPYWGVVGWRTEYRTVLAGYDAWHRPVYTSQPVSVPVYGWVYPAYPRYRIRPTVGIGLGFRF